MNYDCRLMIRDFRSNLIRLAEIPETFICVQNKRHVNKVGDTSAHKINLTGNFV